MRRQFTLSISVVVVLFLLCTIPAKATSQSAETSSRGGGKTLSPSSQTLPDASVSFAIPSISTRQTLPFPLLMTCDETWKAVAEQVMAALRVCGLRGQDLAELEAREKGKSEQEKFTLRLLVLQQLATKAK